MDRTAEIAEARRVDTEVARLWDVYHTLNDKAEKVMDALAKALENQKGDNWLYTVGGVNWKKNEERIPVLEAQLAELRPQVSGAAMAAQDFDNENYKGWSRFFLVKHIHSNQHCSSFRYNTRVMWLPTVSGLTEREAVQEHGETLCTICFPSAPTELTTKQADPSICTEGRDYDAPSRSGYAAGNWGTCTCGQRVAMTSTGKLRKHKKA